MVVSDLREITTPHVVFVGSTHQQRPVLLIRHVQICTMFLDFRSHLRTSTHSTGCRRTTIRMLYTG
ncbi:hypothetical protein JG687_00007230 [Phytophthora cactorum]|uniref:Uncharacterized protein n=1 Tax=Phytophthora cactorum TaxID=29920 RepID=A0A8T1UKB2_9STRA|nr:hypothetical protein JG687_00007230 [Phytophthora cactorum]